LLIIYLLFGRNHQCGNQILRTVDWKTPQFYVITIEYRVYGKHKIGIDKQATLQKLKHLRQFFRDTGVYREVTLIPNGSDDVVPEVVFSRI